jgi:hypothetical protein
MENLPRELEKEIAMMSSKKPARRTRRWMLLFVDDHGKIVPIIGFKWLVFFFGIIAIITMTTTSFLYIRNANMLNENRILHNEFTDVNQKMRTLRSEKELLLARLILAEPEKGESGSVTSNEALSQKENTSEKPSSSVDVEKSGIIVPPRESLPKVEKVVLPETPAISITDIISEGQSRSGLTIPETDETKESLAPDKAEQEKEFTVLVEDFSIVDDPEGNLKEVRFKLINTNKYEGPVSGRTFVVLRRKNQIASQGKWLIFPEAELVSGKPLTIKKGRYFSIFRFNIVKFKLKEVAEKDLFNSATVFVYSENQQLLLEKEFLLDPGSGE